MFRFGFPHLLAVCSLLAACSSPLSYVNAYKIDVGLNNLLPGLGLNFQLFNIGAGYYSNTAARFEMVTRKAVAPDGEEVARNPRARSAKLRVGRRTTAPAKMLAPAELGLPEIQKKGRR